MEINIDNFEKSNKNLYDIWLIQEEIGGGFTDCGQIDVIQKYPYAKSLIISGLNQESFAYLIERYGNQFEAISFWKNKLVSDLSPLGDLRKLKYLHFFFNQKVTCLWDMRNNVNLRGLAIYDFSRLHSIERVETAPGLEYFSVGNRIWSKMEIKSLRPLIHSNISHFAWWGNKVQDNDYECLAQSGIRVLDLPIRQFTVEQLARINASIPGLKGKATVPYVEISIGNQGIKKTSYFLCKGKRRLEKGKDEEKLGKYLAEFTALVEKYGVEQNGFCACD